MIILSKKKIMLIVSCVCLSIITYEINLCSNNEDLAKVRGATTEGVYPDGITKLVNAVPVTNKVIVVDAGHGDPDGGAVGTTGTTEAQINLSIALKLQNLLEESGATVVLTRSDENGIYDESASSKKVSDIKNRVKIGNESSADIFVSIHLNKINESKYSGWQTFYKESSEEGKKLAEAVQAGLNEAISTENNRVAKTIENIYIINNVEIPISIVECGFLSNPEEESKLADDDYQDLLAYGIYLGIMDYFYE